jgi:arginase family enzyme
MGTNRSVYMNLDGALTGVVNALGIPTVDAAAWGPRLRFCAPAREIEAFHEWVQPKLAPFVLFGSGDFHHLSSVWQRQFQEPFVLLVFDNHPDWDKRPPRWACGGWVNCALDNSLVEEAQVWGCGNFELSWPNRLFANRRALREGRLTVRPWSERFSAKDQAHYHCLKRINWLDEFARQVALWRGKNVYVSVDVDCLAAGKASTNWENGLFEPEDIARAMELLRAEANVVGGDLCGAYSVPRYARWTQNFCGWFDHPKLAVSLAEAQAVNRRAVEVIWPALIGHSL